MRKQRHTKRRDRILHLMQKHGYTLHMGCGGPEGSVYWLEPLGKPVGPWTAQKVIASGRVIGQDDGFFEGLPQSWHYLKGSEHVAKG